MTIRRLECQFDANYIGYALAKEYFAMLNKMPEWACGFYVEPGNYHSVYGNRMIIVAKNWEKLQQMLLRPGPVNADSIIVKSMSMTRRTAC